jgi:hypothetical protein
MWCVVCRFSATHRSNRWAGLSASGVWTVFGRLQRNIHLWVFQLHHCLAWARKLDDAAYRIQKDGKLICSTTRACIFQGRIRVIATSSFKILPPFLFSCRWIVQFCRVIYLFSHFYSGRSSNRLKV